jgi:hypothetical protein
MEDLTIDAEGVGNTTNYNLFLSIFSYESVISLVPNFKRYVRKVHHQIMTNQSLRSQIIGLVPFLQPITDISKITKPNGVDKVMLNMNEYDQPLPGNIVFHPMDWNILQQYHKDTDFFTKYNSSIVPVSNYLLPIPTNKEYSKRYVYFMFHHPDNNYQGDWFIWGQCLMSEEDINAIKLIGKNEVDDDEEEVIIEEREVIIEEKEVVIQQSSDNVRNSLNRLIDIMLKVYEKINDIEDRLERLEILLDDDDN